MSGLDVRARRRRRALGAAAGVAVVTVAGSVCLVAAGAAEPAFPHPASAAFLPADGTSTWVRFGQDPVQQQEHWVTEDSPVLFAFPELARTLFWDGYTEPEITGRHWAVLRTDTPSGQAPTGAERGMDLYAITGSGIRLTANLGAVSGFTFTPGVLVLDADPTVGESWTTEGEAVWASLRDDEAVSASLAYSGEYTVQEPTDAELVARAEGHDGCLQVDATMTFTAQGGTDPLLWFDESVLWCHGAGSVAATSSVGDDPVRTLAEMVAQPVLAPPATPDVEARDPGTWRAQALQPVLPHDVYGETTRWMSPAVEPLTVGDTLVVPLGNSTGLSFLRQIDDGLHEVRLVHPGGDVTAVGRVGELVAVTTGRRQLVAYRSDGLRQWTADLADIAITPPVAGPGGEVVVGTLDGAIRAFAAADGKPVWQGEASPEAVAWLGAAGERIFSFDRTGTLSALSAQGEPEWSAAGAAIDAAAASADAVFVVRDAGLERRDAATGDLEWRVPVFTSADTVLVAGTEVFVLTWDGMRIVDARTGDPRGSAGRAVEAVLAGDAVVVDGGGPPRVLDPDGATVISWDDVPPETPGAARYLAADPGGVWVVDSVDGLFRIAP